MRERAAVRVDRAANEACDCDGTLCGPPTDTADGAHSGDGEVTAGDAIQQALEEGCTDKTRALAQAYRALLVAHHYTSPEALEWTWTQMEREGIIIRDGRQYRMQNGGAE